MKSHCTTTTAWKRRHLSAGIFAEGKCLCLHREVPDGCGSIGTSGLVVEASPETVSSNYTISQLIALIFA